MSDHPLPYIQESKPSPDPTDATTRQLLREIDAVEKRLLSVIDGHNLQYATRFDAMDKAVELFTANLVRVPTDTDKQISHLKEFLLERFATSEERFATIQEKFASVQTQFDLRDKAVEQTAKDTKVAVDAALQAAEKAVGKQNEAFSSAVAKSEAATTKQIDQLVVLFQTGIKSVEDKLGDQKDRLTRLEGQSVGQSAQKVEQRQAGSYTAQIIGVSIAAIGLIAAVLVDILSRH